MKYASTINKTKVQDMFYACDYVTLKVIPVILTASSSYFDWSIVLLLISLIILCVQIYLIERKIEE